MQKASLYSKGLGERDLAALDSILSLLLQRGYYDKNVKTGWQCSTINEQQFDCMEVLNSGYPT